MVVDSTMTHNTTLVIVRRTWWGCELVGWGVVARSVAQVGADNDIASHTAPVPHSFWLGRYLSTSIATSVHLPILHDQHICATNTRTACRCNASMHYNTRNVIEHVGVTYIWGIRIPVYVYVMWVT